MHVVFKNIMMAEETREIPANIPPGYVRVSPAHITLLSSELPNNVRKILKGIWNTLELPPFPEVTYGEPYLANNGRKESLVAPCNEQGAIRAWVEQVVDMLGLDGIVIDPNREYHVSVANPTGSPFDSVPDPWNHRI